MERVKRPISMAKIKREYHAMFGGDYKDGCGVCGKKKGDINGWILAISPSGVIECCPTCSYHNAMPMRWINDAISSGRKDLMKGVTVFCDGKYVPCNHLVSA